MKRFKVLLVVAICLYSASLTNACIDSSSFRFVPITNNSWEKHQSLRDKQEDLFFNFISCEVFKHESIFLQKNTKDCIEPLLNEFHFDNLTMSNLKKSPGFYPELF